ncbi:MAG: NifU family protein [Acidimicrobiales bacterium]
MRDLIAGDGAEPDWWDVALLERFWFDRDTQFSPVELLSGGERRRIQLVLALAARPNVLLLDEPTNDLDLDTLRALEDFLDDWPGAVVIVSHDRTFLDRTVDDVLVIDDGRARRWPGGYEGWLEQRRPPTRAAAPTKPASHVRRPRPGRDGRPAPCDTRSRRSSGVSRRWRTIDGPCTRAGYLGWRSHGAGPDRRSPGGVREGAGRGRGPLARARRGAGGRVTGSARYPGRDDRNRAVRSCRRHRRGASGHRGRAGDGARHQVEGGRRRGARTPCGDHGIGRSRLHVDLSLEPVAEADPTDHVRVDDGLTVIVPADSVTTLTGATLDLPSVPGQGGLVIRNPNRPNPLGDLGQLELTGDAADKVRILLAERINPALAAHGGFAELVGVEDDKAFVTMGGGCQGCSMSAATLREGITKAILEAIPEITEVVDTTDHDEGENPYYR